MTIAWRAPSIDDGLAAALAAEAKLRPLTARLLVGRGIVRADLASKFLEPRLADLRRPEGMADLSKALDRLAAALAAGETIGVFGDYDVDGVTTAATLASALRAFGGKVVARAASRHAGYGLGVEDVARFAADGCRLLVTGDCGTSDHEALRAGRAQGLDVIVIDHHELPTGESPAYALINSRRPDDGFPFKGLASCGVAFYLAAALRTRLGAAFDPRELLDLVALGTIADLVPLTDENRILVAAGLKVLSARKRPGLAALAARAELTEGAITAHQAAFRLTPRLNAAGRLGEAQLALDLLLAAPADAARLAEAIDDQNTERQRIQELVWMEARAQAAEQAGAAAVVVGAEGWHQGVVGIVAARLVDELARPAIAVGFKDGEGRGSARTVPGVNLFEALAACAGHLTKFGGHAGAAGMSVTIDRLDGFRAAFVAEAARQLAGRNAGALEVDAEVGLGELDLPFTEELARLGPFGAANREPLFALRGVTARSTRVVGKGHLQLTLDHEGAVGEAIAFGFGAADPGPGAVLDLVATAELDTFRGARRTRLKVTKLARRANGD
ncbi:MAG TPA: single-stranded-DNA-specific exonuclease RecJ [Polyangia bacterium]|nr:single-stranded-DNA-specific exonuclease RecJ [Polyangia bacterium]